MYVCRIILQPAENILVETIFFQSFPEISENSLTKVKARRVQGIIIHEDLTFLAHNELITQKCKIAYYRLTLYPDLSPHLALQLYKAFIRSKLEFGCTLWGFRIHNAKYLKLL